MRRALATIRAWLDSWSVEVDRDDPAAYEVDWLRERAARRESWSAG